MTRTAIRLSAVLAVLAAAVAQWVSPGAGAAPEWAVPQRRVTVTYWDSVDPARNALMANTVIPAYMRLHSEVAKEFTIKYEVVPDLQSKLLAALDAPEPAADLVMVPDWYLPNLYQARVLDPLPTTAWDQHSVIAVAHTYVPQTLAAQMDGGRLYAVPVREHALSLFINNRMFRAAGLDPVRDAPKTWRDVAKLNTRLTKEQGGRTVEKASRCGTPAAATAGRRTCSRCCCTRPAARELHSSSQRVGRAASRWRASPARPDSIRGSFGTYEAQWMTMKNAHRKNDR